MKTVLFKFKKRYNLILFIPRWVDIKGRLILKQVYLYPMFIINFADSVEQKSVIHR
jgi:hypothetical protein